MGTNQEERGDRQVVTTTSTHAVQMTTRSSDGTGLTGSGAFGIAETVQGVVEVVKVPGAVIAGTTLGIGVTKHAVDAIKVAVEQRGMTKREVERTRQIRISETEQTKRARIEHGGDEPKG